MRNDSFPEGRLFFFQIHISQTSPTHFANSQAVECTRNQVYENKFEEVNTMDKIMDAQGKIEARVISGYKKIEDGVVSGYKKIEDGVVSGYEKIENKFVETFLGGNTGNEDNLQ